MKIIDAHNHPDWHGHNLDKYLANMDANGISQTWLLSWECGENEYSKSYAHVIPSETLGSKYGPIPFTRCLNYKERAPERFILGYAPDPRTPDACERLHAAHYIYGAQVCGEVKVRMMFDDREALRLFRMAGRLKMPVTLHLQDELGDRDGAWQEWWGGDIDTLERILQLCPETIFLGHALTFWIHISKDELYKTSGYPPVPCPVVPGGRLIELLRKYPNLYCDFSAGSGCRALKRDPSFALEFLDEFQDRILYARDYFDTQHRDFLNSLDLPLALQEKIYHGNAERLLESYN
ncbi:MAG: amidohydrolase family protein [Victivallales bacterium]|nr:amidohydrolase family protein [Victivallales bacterium]